MDLTMSVTMLIESVSHREPLHKFAKLCSEILNNPIMICDDTFYVLAYAQKEMPEDPVWKEVITRQYSPARFVTQTNIDDYGKKLSSTSRPLFVDERVFPGQSRRVVASILEGSSVRGYVTVLEDTSEITEDSLNMIHMISDLLSVSFRQENLIADSRGQMKNEFASDLLQGRITDPQMLETRASFLGIHFHAYVQVLALITCRPEYAAGIFDRFTLMLNRWCPVRFYASSGETAYFILSFDLPDPWQKVMTEDLPEYLAQEDLECIVSSMLSDPVQVPQGYLEVRQLMRDGLYRRLPGQNRLIRYDLDRIFASLQECRNAVNTAILEPLLISDRTSGTEYVHTLEVFFQCNQNITQTAKKLYLHRNTVVYRLQRIREILPVDLDDYRVRIQLQQAIMLRELDRSS